MFRQQNGLVDPMEMPLFIGLSWVVLNLTLFVAKVCVVKTSHQIAQEVQYLARMRNI